jgi:hypothetical protein
MLLVPFPFVGLQTQVLSYSGSRKVRGPVELRFKNESFFVAFPPETFIAKISREVTVAQYQQGEWGNV